MATGFIDVNGDNPYIKLTGAEGSNDPVGIREKAGNFEVYDVSSDAAKLTMAVSSGNLTVGGSLTVTTDKTDGEIAVPLAPGIAISGTWTATNASNVITVTRTAATAGQSYIVPLVIPHRTTASKGIKLKSISAAYTTSGGASSDVIQFVIQKQTIPADSSASTGAILAGDDDADYDTNHNTDAKRYAAASHTLTVTIPEGEQVYEATGVQYYVKVAVTDAASSDLAFALTGLTAAYNIAAL